MLIFMAEMSFKAAAKAFWVGEVEMELRRLKQEDFRFYSDKGRKTVSQESQLLLPLPQVLLEYPARGTVAVGVCHIQVDCTSPTLYTSTFQPCSVIILSPFLTSSSVSVWFIFSGYLFLCCLVLLCLTVWCVLL